MTLGTPAGTHAYGEPSYWDQRYRQDPGPFDWYQKYKTLAPLFDLYIRRSHRILLVGCGNSTLGEGMVCDGYQDVVNVDISAVVVEAMQQKYEDIPELKCTHSFMNVYKSLFHLFLRIHFVWQHLSAYKFTAIADIKMDVRDMGEFESCCFDAVVDKGTLDSLMCGPNAHHDATKMLKEVGRILKDKGVYILITYGDPSYRLHFLKDIQFWNVTMHIIDRMEKNPDQRIWELTKPLPLNKDGSSVAAAIGSNAEVHYIYVCIKDETLSQRTDFTPCS